MRLRRVRQGTVMQLSLTRGGAVAKQIALMQQPGVRKKSPSGVLDLVAWREWDERYGGLIKRAQQWQWSCVVLALLVALAEAIVIIGVATHVREQFRMWWLSIRSAVWPRRVPSIGLLPLMTA